MPRASVALPDGFHETRPARRPVAPRAIPGQVPLPYVEPYYHPTKGAHFGNRLIYRHPRAILRAWRAAGDWLCKADPWTDPQAFVFMAEFWRVLNEHTHSHGEMAVRLRHNHI